jgi:hypothetical protein
MKQPLQLIIFLMFILTMSYASAITASTCSYMIDAKYYAVPYVINRSVCVNNQNLIPVTVSFSASGGVAPLLRFKENNIVLQPGERRFVPFNVTVTQQLTYTGSIKSTFSVPPELDNFPTASVFNSITVSKGTECTTGQTKNCTLDNCPGKNFCVDGIWGSCVKDDPQCGTCDEDWACTEWSACEGSQQTRSCTDQNQCGTEDNKPIETQPCSLCNVDADCPATECDMFDGCYNNRYMDCSDLPGICSGGVCQTQACLDRSQCQLSGTDSDGDGFDAQCGDCNDNNPSIYPGREEMCNNQDDNCDGQTDEWLYRACDMYHQGACAEGTEECSEGVWRGCPSPLPETCDRADNDCDGQVDESVTRQCGTTDTGECTYGTEQCIDGTFRNCDAVFPSPEIPNNGLDENCDGQDADLCALYSPTNSLYTSRYVPFTMQCGFLVKEIKYSLDNSYFVRACSNCMSVNRRIYFKEGPNTFNVEAVYMDRTYRFEEEFIVDSIRPRIYAVAPTSGYSNGMFRVDYAEMNLRNTTLYIREVGGSYAKYSKEDCPSASRQTCTFEVDISGYDGKMIEYYFLLEDIAGNSEDSNMYRLGVDMQSPILQVLPPLQSVYGGPVTLNLASTEPAEISFNDTFGTTSRKTVVCSSCTSSSRDYFFVDGSHNVRIKAMDKAGNFDEKEINFVVDRVKPDITSTLPPYGYTNGLFTVRYTELNPAKIILSYREYGTGSFTEVEKTNCPAGPNQDCLFAIDISPYDGKEIEYNFTIWDITGAVDSSKLIRLKVDISKPVLKINQFDAVYPQTRVLFNFTSTEPSAINYIDSIYSSTAERTLCSSCTSYSRLMYLDNGFHNITVIARDPAGNEDRKHVSFYVDSIAPAINSVAPTFGYATGMFQIDYSEENCIEMTFGISSPAKSMTKILPCESGQRVRYACGAASQVNSESYIDISQFEGERVNYSFTLKDVAGNTRSRGAANLIVDTQAPEFKAIVTRLEARQLYMNITLMETAKALKYKDNNALEIGLCTNCDGYGHTSVLRKYFAPGFHRVIFIAEDAAGNRKVSDPLEFTVV